MNSDGFQLSCPMPKFDFDRVQMAHGGGGKLMHQLIEQLFLSTFASKKTEHQHDSARVTVPSHNLAFTSDSYVIHPLFFPGGNIGDLSVNGTINDLAMAGAKPLYLSMSFIIEEGMLIKDLFLICQSVAEAAKNANVSIITGDTKVVDKGKGDGLFINTSGIGIVEHALEILPSKVQKGDLIIVNGDIARHGMAIMAVREGMSFESQIVSDCSPLADVIQSLIKENVEIHCLRDLTRGGLASALNEIANQSQKSILLDEAKIPIHEDVSAACEILGLDPLYVANEGKFIAFIPKKEASKTLDVIKQYPGFQEASIIGEVIDETGSEVLLKNKIGSTRIVSMISGEQLPRIC